MENALVSKILSEKKEYLFKGNIDQEIVTALSGAQDQCYEILMALPLVKPSLAQVLAILPGSLDYLLTRKYVKFFLKNITLSGFGIWWLIDIPTAKARCITYNREQFLDAIKNPAHAVKIINARGKTKVAWNAVKEVAPTVIEGAKNIGETFKATP